MPVERNGRGISVLNMEDTKMEDFKNEMEYHLPNFCWILIVNILQQFNPFKIMVAYQTINKF